MSLFFLLNALWWGYRAGATLSRAFLDRMAQESGTTLDLAFQRAQAKDLGVVENALIDFVQFNDQWAWTDPKDFAIDTAAVGTAGLGLAAKVGLGRRVLTVMGVKSAVPLGTIVDGVIDFLSVMIQPGGDPSDNIKKLLGIISRTQAGVDPTLDAFNNVVRSTTALGAILAPIVGQGVPTSPAGFITTGLRALAAAPAILGAVTNVWASLLGVWGAVEPFIPERKIDLPLDPQFRDAVRRFNGSKVFPLDPGLRRGLEPSSTKVPVRPRSRPRAKPRFDPETRAELPPEPGDPLSDLGLDTLLAAQEAGLRLPDGIEIKTILVPGELRNKGSFLSRFRGRNLTDLRSILAELKKG